MSYEEMVLPDEWGLSPQQELVIGSLVDAPGKYQHPEDFCEVLYGETHVVAPAKLRVLMQRCREIIDELTDGGVVVYVKRGKGWRLSREGAAFLRDLAEGRRQE